MAATKTSKKTSKKTTPKKATGSKSTAKPKSPPPEAPQASTEPESPPIDSAPPTQPPEAAEAPKAIARAGRDAQHLTDDDDRAKQIDRVVVAKSREVLQQYMFSRLNVTQIRRRFGVSDEIVEAAIRRVVDPILEQLKD